MVRSPLLIFSSKIFIFVLLYLYDFYNDLQVGGQDMFTGIIQEMGIVKEINLSGKVNRLKIQCEKVLKDIEIGDSISVNGVCLTVSQLGQNWFMTDIMPETLRRTSLSLLRINDQVNLEPSLRIGDKLGGHLVTGHIDGTGIIKRIEVEQSAIWIIIEVPEYIMKYLVMKGSVAVEGVSLTVAYLEGNCFGVSLIPTTCNMTTLGRKKVNDRVNIECDIIAKYVEQMIKFRDKPEVEYKCSNRIDLDFLQRNGFV